MQENTSRTSRLWGGRFKEGPDATTWKFTRSDADRRLLTFDIYGSLAHLAGLEKSEILSPAETKQLRDALESLAQEAKNGSFVFQDSDEDVHSAVERRLSDLVGDLAGKLHTGRSRNDQVVTDLKLYLMDACEARTREICSLIDVLIEQTEKSDMVVPMYTHLQPAQAVPLGHHLLAYAWMLTRDMERFKDARNRISTSSLGAGAGGGSSLPLNPVFVAQKLGFKNVFQNSIDAVSSRDFVSEYAFVACQTMIHLSRMAEELILWNTAEFRRVTFLDQHTTGSSILPQKKNPDIAELVRGKSAGAIGQLTALLSLQKALPLAYNRDLQEDKESLLLLDDTLSSSLGAIAAMLKGATFHEPKLSAELCALDLAEVLVERGLPLRQAHRVVGELILFLSNDHRTLDDLKVEELKGAHSLFCAEDMELLNSKVSVKRRKSPGGGSFESVRLQLTELKKILKEKVA